MQQYIARLNQTFYKLSMRERTLLLAAGLILLVFFGGLLWIEPHWQETVRLERQIEAQKQKLQTLEDRMQSVERLLAKDPDAALHQQLQQLARRDDMLGQRLASYTQELLPPEQMPRVLERMLAKTDNIRLISLHSIAPELIISGSAEHTSETNLYRHGVRLVVEGEYFAIMRYLQEIEALPWRFYWDSFVYRVDIYPLAKVELELYTLSTKAAFVGVASD